MNITPTERNALNEIRQSNRCGSHVGCFRFHVNNTFEHELAKFKICWKLKEEGKRFLTETIFTNGKRADIIDLNSGEVIEILHSETKEQYEEKIKDYPLPSTYVRTSELVDDNKKLIKEIKEHIKNLKNDYGEESELCNMGTKNALEWVIKKLEGKGE